MLLSRLCPGLWKTTCILRRSALIRQAGNVVISSHAATKYNLALYRLAADRLPEAIDTYQRALEQDSSLATVSTALERLLELHEQRQDLPGVHYALAFFARTMSRPEQEVQELEHYLETNPNESTARIARARLDEARAILPD